jgi:hypothetical protein
MPRSGTGISYGHSVFIFSNVPTDFDSAAQVYIPINSVRVPFVLPLCHHLLVFFMIAILTGVRWNLNVMI